MQEILKKKKERCDVEYQVLNEGTNTTGMSEKENNDLKPLRHTNII